MKPGSLETSQVSFSVLGSFIIPTFNETVKNERERQNPLYNKWVLLQSLQHIRS